MSSRRTVVSLGLALAGVCVSLTAAAWEIPLTVENPSRIGVPPFIISTGAAVFTVSKKAFGFLKSAVAGGEELLDGSADLGLVIEDTYGQKYYGADGVKSVTVQENGPVRVCIRAQGRNLARGGKGYSRGMYGYDVFMNFYAGSSDVFADVVVTNNPVMSIGSPTFEDASLLLRLKGGAGGCTLWGEKPAEGKLAAGESVCLYQDSNGADSWESCSGFGEMESDGWHKLKDQLTTFRGFKVWKRAAGKEDEFGAGNQARGLLHTFNDRGGVIVPAAPNAHGQTVPNCAKFPRKCPAIAGKPRNWSVTRSHGRRTSCVALP